ncbi:hypothetical protein VB620_10520, partial [Nodularia harveyana UHCC-0300]
LLTENNRGDYWVLVTDDDIYWLFPVSRQNRRINPRISEIVQILFDCQDYENSDTCEFILKKPAKVSPARSGDGWILEEQGVLDFSSSSFLEIKPVNGRIAQNQLQLELSHKVEQQNSFSAVSRDEFDDYIHQSEGEIGQLKLQIQQLKEMQQKLQVEIQKVKEFSSSLETKFQQAEEPKTSINHQVEAHQQKTISDQDTPMKTSTIVNLNSQEVRIVEAYNSNPAIISQTAKQVSETTASIDKRRQGNSEAIVLEKQAQGYYWLIGREQFYLMPKNGLKINRATVESLEALFDFQGSKVTSQSKFKLIKPAKVAVIVTSQSWQLTERGIIEFE